MVVYDCKKLERRIHSSREVVFKNRKTNGINYIKKCIVTALPPVNAQCSLPPHLQPSVDFSIQMCSVAEARLPLADVAWSHHPQLLTALMGV
jgi:hypothetical protein